MATGTTAAVIAIEVKANTAGARAGLAGVDAQARRTAMASDQLAKSNATTSKSFSDLDKNTTSTNRHLQLLGGNVSRANRNVQFLRNSIRLMKWPALITGAGGAAQALSAAAAGATALTGALAPGVGLVTQYATALGVLGQVAGVVALSQLNDVTAALGGNAEALKRLNPEAQQFVKTLQTFKPELEGLRASVQKPLFTGLTAGLRDALKNLPALKDVLGATARSMGFLAQRAGKLVGSKAFGRDFRKIGETNSAVLRRMGIVGLNLAKALTDVMVAARPLTNWISKLAEGWAKNVAGMAQAGRRSGALTRFFKQTREVTSRLLSIFGGLAGALWNIIKLGQPLGNILLKKIDQAAESFKAWTDSAKGRNAIKQWFEDAKAPLMAMGRLIGDIGVAFFKLADTPGLTKLINALDRDLLPVLVRLIRVTTRAFAPALIDALVPFVRLMGDLAGTSGPLTLLVRALGLLATGLHKLFKASPFVKTMTVDLVGLYAVVKAIGLISGLSSFFGFNKGLEVLSGGRIKTATEGMQLLLERFKAFRATTIATGGMEQAGMASGTKWGKGFRIGAIAALVIGTALIVEEIRRRFGKQIAEGFHRATRAVDQFGGKFKLILAPVKFALHAVITQTKLLWDAISTTSKLISDLVHGRWAAAWKDFKHLGVVAIRGVINVAKFLLGPFYDAAKWIRSKWKNIDLKAPFRGLAGFVKGVFSPIKDAIQFVVQKVKWLIDHIPDIPSIPSPGGVISGAAGKLKGLIGGQYGGMVTGQGIIPVGFQHGGIVGGHARRPGPKDTVHAMLQPGELVIPKKVVEDTRKNAKLAAVAMTGELGKGTKGALKNAVEFVKKHGVSMKQMKDTAGKLTMGFRKQSIDDFTKTKQQGSQQTDALKARATEDFNRLHQNVTGQMDKTRDQSIKASKDTAKGVGKNYGNMVGAVGDGLNKLAKMTNQALKALGVNEVNFGIKTAKPGRHQRGGHISGVGDGDTIPAMLEPGEFVVNKKAARKHRRSLEAINFADAPRFAAGGTAGMQPNAAALANQFVQKFGGAISSGLRPGDPGFHGRGMAFDWVPGDANAATKYANQIGQQILEGIHNPAAWGKQVSWDSGNQVSPSFWGGATWADHVDHLHVAVAQKVAGAVMKKLKRILMTGPDGPLKDMGQASLDKVQKAANAYIAKHAAAQGPEVGPGGTFSKTDLMKLWRSTGSGGSASIMAAIALGESSGNPRAVGHDPGGTEGLGLWQITTGFNDALIARLGGVNAMFDPVKNAKAAHSIFDSQGYGAWVVYNTGAYRQFLEKGGFAGLKGGGDPKKRKPDVTGKEVDKGLGALSTKLLFRLMGDLAEGPASGHEGLRHKVSKMLLGKIADVRKGTPVKPKGHLHDYLNELDVLTLKMKLHKKGKPHEKAFQNLVDWLGDPEDGFYTWQTLRNRKDKWRRLQIKRDIAAKTPNPKDDIRIAKIIADFTGKSAKPGNQDALDAAARTQQLFDFLKLLGPVTSLSTFGRGGKLASGKFGIAGESGPELIRGPATISSPQETASMLTPSFNVRVFIGGRELTDIVDVQIDRSDRAKDLKRRTGVSPAR